MNAVLLYVSVLTFFCAISIGTSLKCYSCQIIKGVTDGNPCQTPVECHGSAVCLSTTITLRNQNRNATAIMKTCLPKTDGKECDRLGDMKHLLTIPGFEADFAGNCTTCETDGCNGDGSGDSRSSSATIGASLTVYLSLSLVSLLWCVVRI